MIGVAPRLFVTDAGEGEPVLLITGWTISSAVFTSVADLYLPHLRVIAYDHRGSGRSGPWPAPVSMAMLAADAARVLEERGVEAAHVVGLSMGAMVALELAVRMPTRVKSLVLVGGTPGGPLAAVPSPGAALRAVADVARDSVVRRELSPASVLFSPRFRREYPDRVEELTRPFLLHRPPPWTTMAQTLATSCFSRHASLGRVVAPTLVVHGTADVMSPVENAAILARGIPGAELLLVRGAGHAVPLESADHCAGKLRHWVRRQAQVVPPEGTRLDAITERATRPFALHAGAWRNTRDLTAEPWSLLGWKAG